MRGWPAQRPMSDNELVIRAARWTDWPQLLRLVPAIFPHIGADEAGYLLRRHHAGTVVAWCRPRLVGYYQFYAHAEPGVAWLNHFGVEPGARGSGEASALLRFFERHALSSGFESVALDAFEYNTRAHRFYERAGFAFVSKQAHEDGVKFRYRKSLSGVVPFSRPMSSISPPGRWVRTCRRLAFAVLTRRR